MTLNANAQPIYRSSRFRIAITVQILHASFFLKIWQNVLRTDAFEYVDHYHRCGYRAVHIRTVL